MSQTVESISKIKLSLTGKKASVATKKKMSDTHKFLASQPEYINPRKGKTFSHTNETKIKISKLHSKIVLQYDQIGNLINEWCSTQTASKLTQISQSNISSCCLGNRKLAGGFIWKYKKLNQ